MREIGEKERLLLLLLFNKQTWIQSIGARRHDAKVVFEWSDDDHSDDGWMIIIHFIFLICECMYHISVDKLWHNFPNPQNVNAELQDLPDSCPGKGNFHSSQILKQNYVWQTKSIWLTLSKCRQMPIQHCYWMQMSSKSVNFERV